VGTDPALPDPERTSQRLLEKMGVDRIPVDLHGLAEVWAGLSIVEEDIDGPGYLLPLGKIGAEIIVRGADPVERKRFTIAHEVGHWVLGITCESKAGKFRQPGGVRHDVIEKWCDRFAVSFLVPRKTLVNHFQDVHEALLVAHVVAAPKHFRVSEEAMFLRLYEVLGMRIAYFEMGSKRITRAFVPDSVVPEMERSLSAPDVREYLHLDALALTVRIGPVKYFCCWRRLQHSRNALLVLRPCLENGDSIL
jgi:hypothetical protein